MSEITLKARLVSARPSCARPAELCVRIERVRELFTYSRETGEFCRKVSTSASARAGEVAGTPKGNGYLTIQIDGMHYQAHRLAWFYENQDWPDLLDHRNGIRSDNRIANLRPATAGQNVHNVHKARADSKTGVLGVSWHSKARKFCAKISANRKQYHLGLFPTLEEAARAYAAAKARLHPFAYEGAPE